MTAPGLDTAEVPVVASPPAAVAHRAERRPAIQVVDRPSRPAPGPSAPPVEVDAPNPVAVAPVVVAPAAGDPVAGDPVAAPLAGPVDGNPGSALQVEPDPSLANGTARPPACRAELVAARRLVRRQQRRWALAGISVLAVAFGATVAVVDVIH